MVSEEINQESTRYDKIYKLENEADEFGVGYVDGKKCYTYDFDAVKYFGGLKFLYEVTVFFLWHWPDEVKILDIIAIGPGGFMEVKTELLKDYIVGKCQAFKTDNSIGF